ncbi:conserved hypothetical protein [Heliomicrobium modesticaldum Ice1]|uniref:YmaF family protein n=1 Tax=Heliobacterium modesticaldum (strain ATCC 51547 / Ice1) TaxID=498761 RepID=B0TGM1_HELMI|nr:YmaF family protein [Heliomicrobium modesticaldum]ABZ83282.1 conserved hypothetical protein [Heliomicrobium modesticaldum Ice1]
MRCKPKPPYDDGDCGFHTHDYHFESCLSEGHRHMLSGQTEPSVNKRDHAHRYAGVTSFNDNHVHYYCGCTGPAIYRPGCGHYHCMEGTTTCDDGHVHRYEDKTCNRSKL